MNQQPPYSCRLESKRRAPKWAETPLDPPLGRAGAMGTLSPGPRRASSPSSISWPVAHRWVHGSSQPVNQSAQNGLGRKHMRTHYSFNCPNPNSTSWSANFMVYRFTCILYPSAVSPCPSVWGWLITRVSQQHSSPSVSKEAAEILYSSSNEAILFHLSEGRFTCRGPSIFGIYLMCQEIVEDESWFRGSVTDLSPPYKDSLTWRDVEWGEPTLSSFIVQFDFWKDC